MPRPHTHAGEHSPEYERSAVCGISEREKCPDDIRQARESKVQIRHRHFWCRGYYVDTVGKNEKKIAEYIREQLQSDIMEDQISLKEFVDPFTGEKNK